MQRSTTPVTLREIRTGAVSLIGTSDTRSAIVKALRTEAVFVGVSGLDGDEQAETFHGGMDRAVLHYDASHYSQWAREFPNVAENFLEGAFGENFAAAGIDETSICIGDMVRVGGTLFQVSEPRNPCFKLDLRLQQQGISKRAKVTGRTGWFYRVIETGNVKVGDSIVIVDRALPDWPVSRVQHFMYGDTSNLDAARTIVDLPFLSAAIKQIFARRLEQSPTPILVAAARVPEGKDISAEISEVTTETPSVKAFTLRRKSGEPFPPVEPGAHIDVMIPEAGKRSYSLCDLADGGTYKIAVQLDPCGRGGSRWIHAELMPGSTISISPPKNFFPIAKIAKRHIMIAGGIGITPFLAMARAFERAGQEWELHYCVRQSEDVAFRPFLNCHPERVHIHLSKGPGSNRLEIDKLLEEAVADTHIYCCGSQSLMKAVRQGAAHWPSSNVHFEAFWSQPNEVRRAFDVLIESTGNKIHIPRDRSLLDVLRSCGYEIDSLCESGTCGSCRLSYTAGSVDHRDLVLSDVERRGSLISCVSRGLSDVLHIKL